MNITNFEYKQSPFSKIKRFEIRPLSENGTDNYMTKDSYVHRYLKSLDHERIDEIFDYGNSKTVGKDKRVEEKPKIKEAEHIDSVRIINEKENPEKL